MISLVITVTATKSYCYAMRELCQRVKANLNLVFNPFTFSEVKVVIAGDDSRECKEAVKYWGDQLRPIEVTHIAAAVEDNTAPNYKPVVQMINAKLRTAAFTAARSGSPKYCWSLDSDTLPPGNALRCMLTMLEFDAGYYSVSTCPYPNEAFLGGRGTPQNQIAEDFLESERVLPEELQKEIAALKLEAGAEPDKVTKPTEEWIARRKKVDEAVRKCPPQGNVWEMNAKHGWRRRGWLEHAYPAIGKGSVVPSDWCGFGCTLMNAEALNVATFDGYDGQGTEDLFIVWNRWYPASLRINVIPHCPCDHVIWDKKKGGAEDKYTIIMSSHEMQGECVGHLRTRRKEWKP